MNFFDVGQCGLFKNGSNKSHGLDMAETFQLIADWVAGKPMAATLPWETEKRADGVKCYCHDIYKSEDTGDFLFILWKSTSDSNGTLLGAPEDKSAGEGNVIEYTNAYKGQKVIWGRPCYYWVVPSLNTVISIKFEHSICDSQLFQDWVSACITNHVKHSNKIKEHTDKGHTRLHFTDGTQESTVRFRYGFNMNLKSLDTADGKLAELAAKITHIIKRETIELQPKDEREEWVKMFDKIPYLKPKSKSVKRQIEIKAEARPTAVEVKEIIEKFARDNRKGSDWDNVGFETESHGTIWVDRYRMKNSVEYNYGKGVIAAADLMTRLNYKRSNYLDPIRREMDFSTQKNGDILSKNQQSAAS
ncbi:hypothetical protein [Undibacterium sp.]|uniref:hypothetical protein n=1 Tax=Undibacterium sp. TaxID=1914977 RepID=UPI00272B2745|nr:hypothetical protein [Undibacterium sp.]